MNVVLLLDIAVCEKVIFYFWPLAELKLLRFDIPE